MTKRKFILGLLASSVVCTAVGFAACGATGDGGEQNGGMPTLVGPVAILLTPTEIETHVNDTFSLTMRYNWGDFDVTAAFGNPDGPQPDFNISWECSAGGAVECRTQEIVDNSCIIFWFDVGNYACDAVLTGTSVANPQATASVEVTIQSDGGDVGGGDVQSCPEEKLELTLVDDHYVVTGLGEYELGSVGMGTYWDEPKALTIINEPFGIPITEIADGAFAGNTEITHFESLTVTKIGDRAFENCTALQTIYLEENIEIGDYAFTGCEVFESAVIRSVKSVGDYAFAGLTNFSSAMGGEGDLRLTYVENGSIGAHAFEGCTAFSYMDGGAAGLTVGEYAFAGCTGFESVQYFGCGTINSYAFDGCVNIDITPSAEKFMPYAFNGCTALTGVKNYAENVEILENAFAGCENITSVHLDKGALKIGAGAFADCVKLAWVTSNGDIGVIEENAFKGCKAMYEFNVTGSVGEVKTGAFERVGTEVTRSSYKYLKYHVTEGTKIFRTDSFKNAAFSELDLSKSETIEVYSFRTCTGEVDIVLPNWMTEIPDKMFAGFMGMRSVTFAPNTTSIGEEAFYNCSVTTLVLPATILNIGTRAFASSELQKLSVETLETPNNTYEQVVFENGAFRDCKALEEIALDGWMTSRPKIAFGAMEECFSGCTALKKVNLGNVNYIGYYAFANVRSLTSFSVTPWKSDTTPVSMSLYAKEDGSKYSFFLNELADSAAMATVINSGNYDKYSWSAK